MLYGTIGNNSTVSQQFYFVLFYYFFLLPCVLCNMVDWEILIYFFAQYLCSMCTVNNDQYLCPQWCVLLYPIDLSFFSVNMPGDSAGPDGQR